MPRIIQSNHYFCSILCDRRYRTSSASPDPFPHREGCEILIPVKLTNMQEPATVFSDSSRFFLSFILCFSIILLNFFQITTKCIFPVWQSCETCSSSFFFSRRLFVGRFAFAGYSAELTGSTFTSIPADGKFLLQNHTRKCIHLHLLHDIYHTLLFRAYPPEVSQDHKYK